MYRQSLYLILSFYATALFGQATPPLETTTEEVVVTGSRFPRLAADGPEHVTVIDSATIARSTSLAELLNEQAGIVVNGAYSNFGKDRSLFLRNGANQYTLILVDGQPLIDPSSLGGAVDLRLLSLEGLDRIEILRGARSLLYGSDAVAGVINLVTSGPTGDRSSGKGTRPDPFTLHLRAAAQRYGTLEGNAGISGRTEKLDYRVSYDHFRTDGISEATPPEGVKDTFNRDGAQRQTLLASLTYRPTERWSIRPSLRRASFDGDYDAGSFQDAANRYTNDLWLPSVAIDYRTPTLSAGARYNYAATDRVFNDAFGESAYRGRAQQGDVFLNLLPSETLALTLGVQLRREALEDQVDSTENLTATNASPYAQLNLNLLERVLVEAGARYNFHSDFGGQANGSLAVGYRHTESLKSRISVATAFQSPTLDQLGGPFGANPDLAPQVSTSLEAGLEFARPGGPYRASLSVFQRTIEQIIIYGAEGYANQDELRDRGVELEARSRLDRHFTVNGNFTFVQGRLSSPDGQGGTTESREFYRRPRVTGLLGLTFRAEKPFTARLTAAYTGERPDVYFDAGFNRFTTELDPYVLVNVYAEYKLLKQQNLTLFGEVRNLTDTDFTEVTGFSTLGITPRVGVAWTY
ncbi:vitamin B12 transporter [Neolewinella xylanilytica]|uniref:Vitamin B12 transporter n=1 Tax=Neolewinella xylanilytica TaxID=1514080 RepID=A0A2S6I303_9BACT|nr:TonB-dependent receptor [Neolewinella xylanilytica]PPK85451.1 vitamin B12 transporter [Neolewinella xylanilytica]